MPRNFDWKESWSNTWPLLALIAISALAYPWGLAGLTVVLSGWVVYDVVKGN